MKIAFLMYFLSGKPNAINGTHNIYIYIYYR